MTFLYIDESGDMGVSESGSKYFIITCIKISDDKTNILFKRIPKDVRERTLTKKTKKQSELKFSNSSNLIRERFLSRVSKLDIEIYSLIIDKEYAQQKIRNNLQVIYNYLIKVSLEKILTPNNKITVCIDKFMSAKQLENFETYIYTEFFYKFKKNLELNIIQESSNHNSALQVTDFVCGAFGYKYNTAKLNEDCEQYTSIIKNRIKEERNDFFKKK